MCPNMYVVPWDKFYTNLNSLQDFYYMAFPNDRLILKLVVFLELMLETVQTVAVTHDVFVFFTTDPLVINQIGSSWYSIPLLTGLSAWVLRTFIL